jgi:hypothetical protein
VGQLGGFALGADGDGLGREKIMSPSHVFT